MVSSVVISEESEVDQLEGQAILLCKSIDLPTSRCLCRVTFDLERLRVQVHLLVALGVLRRTVDPFLSVFDGPEK